jgi:hypothetical protein
VPRATARRRAEDLVVRIEGALVVSAGTGSTDVFARAIGDLPESVLAAARQVTRRPGRPDVNAHRGPASRGGPPVPASDANRTFACGRSSTVSWKMSGRA